MKKIISEKNPELVTRKDNKAQWNLPNKRRLGFRNLYKINRYGIYLRSDFVLKLKKKINKRIGKLSSVKKVTKNKAFCSLIVGKDQDILFEQYAKDFSTNQPQTIMSITKMFIHLFVGELIDRKLINLNKKISFYLPKIGSGYANAKVKDVLDMNIVNLYSEDYTKAYSSSFLHEPVGGWRLPIKGKNIQSQEQYLNSIKSLKSRDLKNYTDLAHYKSANTDVIGLIVEKVSKKSLRQWLLETVEATGFEEGLYIGTDRFGTPWMSGGGSLITRDFLRMGLLFSRFGKGINGKNIGSKTFLSKTINSEGPKYIQLSKNKFVCYVNSLMKCGNWIGHSGYGGQFLGINLKTKVVAAFFSVLETKSATNEKYKKDMVNMIDQIISKDY